MPLPVASLISAMTPLVLGAVDLYRKRREDTANWSETEGGGTSREALTARLKELEASDLEQARLIQELSRSLEVMAQSVASAQEARKRALVQLQRAMWALGVVSLTSLGLAIWALVD